MTKRLLLISLIAGVLTGVCVERVWTHSEPAATPSVTKVANFELKDVEGKSFSLSQCHDRKAVAVIFLGTECPINNAYLPRLAELQKEFGPKGVQFVGINSNRQDTANRLAEYARKHAVPFPLLKDNGSRVADLFAAQRTPEAIVLDAERVIRYRGRIDDQFGYGYNRPKPTRNDLAEALNEVLADKPVSQPKTKVSGCIIARAVKPKETGDITYAKHAALILQNHCQECHRPGQVGPMPLMTYDDASAWAETIREVLQDGRMPPWYADPRYGKFSNDCRLSAEEKSTLLAWIDQGAAKGEDKDMPPPREFASEWLIGKPDVVLTMAEEFDVPAEMPKGGIPYQNFFVETNFKEDRWVVSAESRPGALPVVHHIVVFIVPPGSTFFPGNPRSPTLCGTAPGEMALKLPPGYAKRVPAGSKLVFQMHYTPNGTAQKDRSSLGLIFAKEPPERQVLTMPIANPRFMIPPGNDNYLVESNFTFREDGKIIGFMPHMHLRGKDFLYEAIYPDDKTETLLSVPRYNFNWQSAYRLADPKPLPKGTKIHCVAHFDNSANNPNNPDPRKVVFWGDQTWEEMMIGWIDYVYERKPE